MTALPAAAHRSARPRLFAADDHLPFTFAGNGEVGALLLHGFAGTPAEMRPLGEALAAVGIAAHGPLLPGFGADIERLGQMGAIDWLAAAAQAWEDVRRHYPRTVLLGFSMGGAVALRLAAQQPPDRLILLAPLWRLLGLAWPAGALLPLAGVVMPALAPFRLQSFDNPAVRGFFARAAADLDIDDPEVRRAVMRHARVPTRALAQLWRVGIGSGAAARHVTSPTLIIQGSDDRAVYPRDTRALTRRFSGPTRLEEVAAGHQVVDRAGEAWGQVRDLVLGFSLADSGSAREKPSGRARPALFSDSLADSGSASP